MSNRFIYDGLAESYTIQPLPSFDRIKALYKHNKTFLSAPHVILDKTFIRSSDLVHLHFKDVMCGINESFESNIRPRNLASPMVRMCVPFR